MNIRINLHQRPEAERDIVPLNQLPIVASTTTNSVGNYKLTGIPAGEYLLSRCSSSQVPPERYGDEVRVSVGDGDQILDIDYEIQPGISVSGYVSDSNDARISGALVMLNTWDGGFEWVTSTDHEGRFSFSRVPQTYSGVRATKRSYSMAFLRREDFHAPAVDITGLNLILTEGRTVSGTLLDEAGNPVRSTFMNLPDFIWPQSSWTDANGQFELLGVPISESHISFSTWPRTPYRHIYKAKIELGNTPLDNLRIVAEKEKDYPFIQDDVATCEDPGVICGRVVDINGKPVPEARVHFPDEGHHFVVHNGTNTDADGRFSLEYGFKEPFSLYVKKDGYSVELVNGILPESKENVFTLKPLMKMEIELRDASSGAPITFGCFEEIFDSVIPRISKVAGDFGRCTEYRNSDGNFSIKTAYNRVHRMHVFAEGYASGFVDVMPNAGPARLALEREHVILGFIMGVDGTPLSGANIFARRGDWNGFPPEPIILGASTTQHDGGFEIKNLRAAQYTIEVRKRDYTTIYVPIDLRITSRHVASLVLIRSGTIVGSVSPEKIKTHKLAEVVRISKPRQFETEGSDFGNIDENGIFEFDQLPPGTYRVRIGKVGNGNFEKGAERIVEVMSGGVTSVAF